jgi:hypothetical protein
MQSPPKGRRKISFYTWQMRHLQFILIGLPVNSQHAPGGYEAPPMELLAPF